MGGLDACRAVDPLGRPQWFRPSETGLQAADCRLIPCYKLIAYASDSKVARKSADADE
jgi:hypothetical protein